MGITFELATETDVPSLLSLRTEVAADLEARHGRGPWARPPTEDAVRRDLTASRVMVAREGARLVGTLTLAAKKPFAIDVSCFTAAQRPSYLLAMAVAPQRQGTGIGRRMLEAGTVLAHSLRADAIRLDAYDSPAGAGPFYARCGFVEVGRVVYRSTPLRYYERML
jgi:GNAT superfamily N-acetyltransferase